MVSREEVSRHAEVPGKLRGLTERDPAFAVQDVVEGERGDARTSGQFLVGDGMLFHQVPQALQWSEAGMLVDRILIISDQQPQDVEILFLVLCQRAAVEKCVDHLDRTQVLFVAEYRARGKLLE